MPIKYHWCQSIDRPVNRRYRFSELKDITITTGLEPIARLSDALETGRDELTKVLAKLQEVLDKMSALDDRITELTAAVQAESTVIDSAVALINGFAARLQAAIDAALAAGASTAELQSLTDLKSSISAKSDELSAAVAANTPAAPTP